MTTSRRTVLAGALAAVGGLIPVPAAAAPRPRLALGTRITLPSGRVYYLTPPGGSEPAPLFVGLHGLGNSPQTFADGSGLPALPSSGRRAVIAVAEGLNGKWNAGPPWPATGVDDVGYLDDIALDASVRTAVDQDHRYLVGHSLGAMMAYTDLAQSATYAGAGIWSGSIMTNTINRPVRIMRIHGFGDTTVPYAGGPGGGPAAGMTFPPTYREANKMPAESVWTEIVFDGGHGITGWAANVSYDQLYRDR